MSIEGSEAGVIQEQLTQDASSQARDASSSSEKSRSDPSIYAKAAAACLDPEWVNSIKERLRNEPKLLKPSSFDNLSSIYRVPQRLRQHNENAYMPRVVSIGPFHHGEERLKAMEEHKWRYLNAILVQMKRRDKEEDWLEKFLVTVKLLEGRARSCYSQEIDLDSDSFVEMMLLDGCFIIELLASASGCSWSNGLDDPILKMEWMLMELVLDLLNLENQIPFVILQHLFDLMNFLSPTLEEIAFAFFHHFQPNYKKLNRANRHVQHLLHLLHSSLLPFPTEPLDMDETKMIRSASELEEVGIKLKKKGNAGSLLDIRFQKERGAIEIPPLVIVDHTKAILLNLVAFEQCYSYCDYYFRAYITFMDCLVKSTKDVEILCENGIIDNGLGNNEELADFFNKIRSAITLSSFDFDIVNVFNDINSYCKAKWKVRRARLKRNFLLPFSSCVSQ